MSFKDDRGYIVEKSCFLLEHGYTISEPDDNSVNFTTTQIKINISYDKFDDISNVSLFFTNERELFNIGWIAFIRNGIKLNPHDKLNNIIELLAYMKNNFSKITDISYCLESRKMIEEYIKSRQ